jgi:hypothetical protein
MKKSGRTTFHWDPKLKTHVEIPIEEHPMFKKKNDDPGLWVAFYHKETIALAKQTRNVLLAVMTELHRLYFRAWDKREPIVFNHSKLGLDPDAVLRALKSLEKAKWISVERKRGQYPRVTVHGGLHLPDNIRV